MAQVSVQGARDGMSLDSQLREALRLAPVESDAPPATPLLVMDAYSREQPAAVALGHAPTWVPLTSLNAEALAAQKGVLEVHLGGPPAATVAQQTAAIDTLDSVIGSMSAELAAKMASEEELPLSQREAITGVVSTLHGLLAEDGV